MHLSNINKSLARNEKIAMLTCYDATYAKIMEAEGVDILLVGDSLGMVLQGYSNTLEVTMQDMMYHTKIVASGAKHTPIMADMPYGSYEHDKESALSNAQALLQSGAHIVKLEGGGSMVETAHFLVTNGVPVCAHLGFTPQSVEQLGGYKIQGKTEDAAKVILQDAQAMSDAGVSFVLLEMVPAQLACNITQTIAAPTIGIGAGVDCSGQVLVLQDLLGIYTGPADKEPQAFKAPRFVRNFLSETGSVQSAIRAYVHAVKNKTFPATQHSY
ncbi:MAG: 3-methyl-2-oxobutanoate hydroxymethyltransferase [Methylophilaceae bacterium 17-44-8]|jgi:3-methyl-2-oxobutanoate hydroxymethyltransferase|nr:MAG: 3-methyl-2-oxobutanoate hydroxymethyltransferase [Methylophilales bacterium 28-44-11]OZA06281.1 MAG: 3-methyl-2-oxobutanoate hydroxymethyltransferase [Methylophilaceae bacterium 17-44-8]